MPIEPPTGVDFADPISWIVAAASRQGLKNSFYPSPEKD